MIKKKKSLDWDLRTGKNVKCMAKGCKNIVFTNPNLSLILCENCKDQLKKRLNNV